MSAMEVTIKHEDDLDKLAQLVASTLAERLKEDLRKEVLAAVTDSVRGQVGDIVTEVIKGMVQVTNAWGEPTGKSTTLREQIIKEAQEYLGRKVDARSGSYDRYSGRDSIPLTTYIAREEAKRAIDTELKDAAAKAVADVKQTVADLVTAEIGAKVVQAVTRGRMKASNIMAARVEGVDFLKQVDLDLKLAAGMSDMSRASELLNLRADVCKTLKRVGFHPWPPPLDKNESRML